MKRYLLTFLICWIPSLGSAGGESVHTVAEGTAPMPEILLPDDSGSGYADPRYIAPNQLLDAKGEVDRSLYQPAFVRFYEGLLGLPEVDGCIEIDIPEEPMNDPLPQWRDLESIAQDAHWILHGKVTGLAPGFNLQHAGTLVRISPEQWFKNESTLEDRYLLFPMGEFSIGDKRICASHGQWPEIPALGDEIVLMLDKQWSNMDGKLLAARGPQVIVIRAGKVLLPIFLKDEDPGLQRLTKGAFLSIVRAAVAEKP